MNNQMYRPAIIQRTLLGLVIFDITLCIWVFFFPEFWFRFFHGAEYIDPQALLIRCGANWAAFVLLQFLAWRRWEKESYWLAIVAGVRLSDIFTDAVCVTFSASKTWMGVVSLYGMMPINILLGLYFIRAFKVREASTR